MSRSAGSRLVIIIGYLALLGLSSCKATDYRDAALGGVLDFISSTVSDSLTALFPIADILGGG